jgi:hypothetical protein
MNPVTVACFEEWKAFFFVEKESSQEFVKV